MIEIQNLKKSFPQFIGRLEILKDINLSLGKGDTAAIVGKSGSGKSTLLALLSGLDHADSGKLAVAGDDLTQMSEEQLTEFRAKNIGIIFQQFHLLNHLSALENVALALDIIGEKNSSEVALGYLKQVGLGDRANHFPSQLSGGEKQRVAMARAISLRPNLLLADEPSGSLDQETAAKVMDILFELVKKNNLTLILVTHDMDLAKNCHQQFRLNDGVLTKV